MKSLDQCIRIHNRAARGIDQQSALPHQRKLARSDQFVRLGCKGQDQNYDLCSRQKTVQLSDGLNNAPSEDRAEEYCPFDLQLSVDKQASLLATSGATTPGRVAPGVPARAPDTTVGDPRAIGRTTLASDVAQLSPFTVANQGNVTVVPVPLLTNQAQALPVTAGNRTRSLDRTRQRFRALLG